MELLLFPLLPIPPLLVEMTILPPHLTCIYGTNPKNQPIGNCCSRHTIFRFGRSYQHRSLPGYLESQNMTLFSIPSADQELVISYLGWSIWMTPLGFRHQCCDLGDNSVKSIHSTAHLIWILESQYYYYLLLYLPCNNKQNKILKVNRLINKVIMVIF